MRSLCLRDYSLPTQLVVERCIAIFRPQLNPALSNALRLLPREIQSECQPFIVGGAECRTPELQNWKPVELVMASAFRIQPLVTCD